MFKKKFLYLLPFIFYFLFFIHSVFAASDKVFLHFFWARGCPHCAAEKVFLAKLQGKYPALQILSYEITENPQNLSLLQRAGEKFQTDVSGVPFTAVGEKFIIGFYTEETTGVQIEEAVKCNLETKCQDIVSSVKDNNKPTIAPRKTPYIIKFLFFPVINIKELSLPALSLIIGLIDGFNPCAMWVLIFLISLLLPMKNVKRRWVLGFAFILSSAFVYFLFLTAWLNFFLVVGYIFWVRNLIGLIAIASGAYYLRDFFKNKKGECQVVQGGKKKKIMEQIKNALSQKSFLFALLGIVSLAFAVNLVELVCSAGLPAIYTQILSLAKVPFWQYYFYIFIYLAAFMFDDVVVFFGAMFALKIVGMEGKYARVSRLFGGILIFLIGILLLFKPEVLMLGG